MSSNLSMVEARLPPGFRFHPRDEELVCDYLMKKLAPCDLQPPLLVEVDLNKSEPWDIPETACVGQKEWYFYSRHDRKYATGLRTNRATASGYWKATGKDRPVLRKGTLVGMRKTLVFYQGRAPKGRKTDWVMHEFRLEGPLLPPKLSSSKEDWVLCRVFYKSREVPGKLLQGMSGSVISSCYGDTHSSSSSLPPLMEPYHNITFDHHHHQTQTQGANDIDNDNMSNPNLISTSTPGNGEQVPCFSIFATNYQTNQTFSPSHMLAASSQQQQQLVDSSSNPICTKITSNSPTFGPISTFPSRDDVATYLNPSFSCEKMVLKAVLNQYLNKNHDHQDSIINHLPKVVDHQSSSFGDHEGSTFDQIFLSDNVGLPNTNTMWYHSLLS